MLEPNHTHFIFVDDESVRKYGREIDFRAALEQSISGGRFASRSVSEADETNPNPHASFSSSQQQPGLCNRSSTFFIICEPLDSVPVVLLVVEGGDKTFLTGREDCLFEEGHRFMEILCSIVYAAVVTNNIPAVFFEGTGRCCDLFAKALRLYQEYRRAMTPVDDLGG